MIGTGDIRRDLEKRLELDLGPGAKLAEPLASYAEARRRSLEGSMGPGGCRFHLWARWESREDPGGGSGTGAPARILLGHLAPQCRSPASPVALRSVRWRGAAEEPRPWRGPLPGISVALEDGSIEVTSAAAIAHTLDAVPATETEFERGFLRPGDSLELFLWELPRAEDRPLLEIELVVVDERDLEGPVLLPERRTDFVTVYRRAPRGADRDLAGLARVPWKKDASPETVRLVRPLRPPTPAR